MVACLPERVEQVTWVHLFMIVGHSFLFRETQDILAFVKVVLNQNGCSPTSFALAQSQACSWVANVK
jgi:hypothetical protein